MLQFVVAFMFAFLFLLPAVHAANADEVIADVNIAGVTFKDMVVDLKDFSLVEEVSVGSCKSRNLRDFGDVLYISDKNLILISTLSKNCMNAQEVDLAHKVTFTPTKSTSVFLNFNFEKQLGGNSSDYGNVGAGVFAFDTLLYSSFRYDPQNKFEKEYFYIQRDIDSLSSVIRVGDIYANTNSFLVSPPDRGSGILFQRKWSLRPDVRAYQSVSKQITLTSKSIVEIVQNNVVVFRTELPPGIYSLANIPVSGLIGAYRIRITDAFGRTSEYDEVYVASMDMLKAKMFDYSLAFLFEDKEIAGYFRYGITDNINAGIHFSRQKQSVSIDYLSKFGQTSVEISTKGDYRLAHVYQKDNTSAALEVKSVDKKESVAATVSYSTENLGAFSVRFEKEQDKKAKLGVGWSKSFGNINVSANATTDSEFSIHSSYATRFLGKHINLGLSFSHNKNDNRVYAYLNVPLEEVEKTYGLSTRVSKQDNSTSLESELKARYVFDYTLKNSYNTQSKDFTTTLGIQGGLGCVAMQGRFKCSLGGYIPDGSGFIVGSGAINVENRERTGLSSIQPYRDINVQVSNEFVSIDKKIATRSGQGVLIPRPVLVLGRIIMNQQVEKIYINDEEVYLSTTGEFSYVATDNILLFKVNGHVFQKKIDSSNDIVSIEIDLDKFL